MSCDCQRANGVREGWTALLVLVAVGAIATGLAVIFS